LVAALSIAAPACRHARYPPLVTSAAALHPVVGSRADMHTTAGDKDGYHVDDGCRGTYCFDVVGLGSRWYPGMERERINENARFMAGFEKLRGEVTAALAGLSVDSSGWGNMCRRGGAFFFIRDWRDVDEAIRRVGAFFRAQELRENVTICVGALNPVDV
jgi:hypothetical protein